MTSAALAELCDRLNARVVLHRLPGARGMVTKTHDGYLVLIDENLSDCKKLDVLRHELAHIQLGHLDHRRDLDEAMKEDEVKIATKNDHLALPR